MSLSYGIPSPLVNQPGAQVFSFVGTAIAFSAGLAIAYSGLGIQNPAGSKVKITILKIGVLPSTTPGNATVIGIGKLVSTSPVSGATLGTLSGVAGVITSPGVFGTTTGAGLLFGTATVLNGTSGPSANGLCFTALACAVAGTNTNGGLFPVVDLSGEITLMPGESGVLLANVAVTAFPGLVWVESPIQ